MAKLEELKFGTYAAKSGTVQAAKVEGDPVEVLTSDGPTVAHPGDYVVVLGERDVEHHGPHKGPKGEDVFETRLVKAPVYGVLSADEFGFTYEPAAE